MFEVGRLCLKIAGRDSNKRCVILANLDDSYVLIDGETRRKKCNILHIEPLTQVIDISENASHEDVVAKFKEMGFKPVEKKKTKVASERVKKSHKSHKTN